MSTLEMQIAGRVGSHPYDALTNLHQFIDESLLDQCLNGLNRKSASGIDKETWSDYDQQRNVRIPQLLSAFKTGKYRAPLVRRVYIPKGDGKMRPLGLPTIEDKVLQTAVVKVIMPIYETMFHDISFGFRPGKSQHQAIDHMFKQVSFKGMRYIIDADLQNYFGTISHELLRKLLSHRINDGLIKKMINKWLKAGVLEDGVARYPTEGTPQGGSISPLLSNIYLHYVLDDWFIGQIQPLLKGRSFIVRFADDFVLGFTDKNDAERVMKVLPKRFGKYLLTLHPEKTKLIDLKNKDHDGCRSFDFLGFSHFLGKSRKGADVLKRKTSSKKLTTALLKIEAWIKSSRHEKLTFIMPELAIKLRGHYQYYGIVFNIRSLGKYYLQVKRRLHKWINRRGGKPIWNWEKINLLTELWLPLPKPKIYHSYY